MIDKAMFLMFYDRALDQMVASVEALGDDLVNERPPVPGANSAFGLVTHCIGVMGHWGRHVNLGVDVPRDREAEFSATGTVAELLAALEEARGQFHEDVMASDPEAPPAVVVDDPTRFYRGSQGGVLVHVYEELAQHCGHLDVTRDALLGG